ncbi:MAG: hypothetical protein EZS28_037381 [Streblomastix strix]|uniref:Uncharacterized protein n=1 Tax=Streblomastix strix TaxID=222440 RepID=A0A5J4UA90_9EUKA|nr:MAG: hypothetical protein EZS28_037381 [Streblomastix strix]
MQHPVDVLKKQRIKSLVIRSDNSTAVFDIYKQRTTITLIKKIKHVYKTIEKLGIQIQITYLPEVKNEIADAQNRLSKAGDYKLKEKIFLQTCLQMNLNPTIDLFSQQFNNLLPRFMSPIRGHGEIAIDALNQAWKKEFHWIHPLILLIQIIQMKIGEDKIREMIIVPLWPSQMLHTELVNQNVQYLILGRNSEILEPGTLLIKKNLKLPSGKICCFMMDRRPDKEEYMQEQFQEQQIYLMEQQT